MARSDSIARSGFKGRSILKEAFGEIKRDPPAILAKTRRKKGPAQANKQRVAIGLSKARQAGVRIPKAGRVKKLGS